MAIEKLHIDRFLELGKKYLVLDVRSPGEYAHAHIPGAINLPLFTDEERKIVGTIYKQQSREDAIKAGLDYFGPKMRAMIESVQSLLTQKPAQEGSNKLLVHCWRGGMRSAGVAWLLDLYGYKVFTLTGGYKSYRHWIIASFSLPFVFTVLGGYTGSGKTYILEELKNKGEAVIDLEMIAGHKGSTFGNIGLPSQPSQEMFENLLGRQLRALAESKGLNFSDDMQGGQQRCIWLEDESQRIGAVNIPHKLWRNMIQSSIVFIEIPFEERLKHILQEYGMLDREKCAAAIVRIKKRLGGLETKMALQYLEAGDVESCFRILLKYYDKLYRKALNNRGVPDNSLTKLDCNATDAAANATRILTTEMIIK